MTRRTRRVAAVLLVVYLVGLIVIATWPTPVDRPVDGMLFRVLGELQRAGLGWITYDLVESAANVALFVPFGLLLAVILPRGRRWIAVVVCVAATCAIELTQRFLLPARDGDIRDVLANSAGGLLGVLVVVLVDRLVEQHRRRRSPAA